VVGARYHIGSTTQAYVVTLNCTSTYSVEISARGAGLPFSRSVNSTGQVLTNCSSDVGSYCEMELTSPLVNSWHYLAVYNWLNETSVVSLQVLTTGQ